MKRVKNIQLDNLLLSFKEIWNYDKRLIFLLLADVFISAIRPFPNIILSGRIVDSIAYGKNFLSVIFYMVLMFGINYFITAIGTFLSRYREYLFIKLSNKLDNDVNEKC